MVTVFDAMLYGLCVSGGTQNALKIAINFCFWYIERNLGGDDEKLFNGYS